MQKSEKQEKTQSRSSLNQQSSNPSQNLTSFQSIITRIREFSECIKLQIQAQQSYQTNITKFVERLNVTYSSIQKQLQNSQTRSSSQKQQNVGYLGSLIKFLAQIHSQKIRQIDSYKKDLISEHQQLSKVVQKSEETFSKRLIEIKGIQKDSKSFAQKIKQQKQRIQKTLVESDQKLIINQIAILNRKNTENESKNYSKFVSEKIVKQQKLLIDSYSIMTQQYKNQMQQFHKTMKSKWKSCNKAFEEAEQKFRDFVKRQTIQRVSLIRNMQYDIDNFIKKCGLFDDQLNNGEKQTVELVKNQSQVSQQSKKKQKKIGKMVWEKASPQSLQNNPNCRFMKFKQRLLQRHQGQNQQKLNKKEITQQNKLNQLLKKIEFQQKQSFSIEVLQQYYINQKGILMQAIQSYRMNNKFKFELASQFQNLKTLIKFTIESAYQQQDFLAIKNAILYASSYFHIKDQGSSTSKKICAFDSIKRELPFLRDLLFWKFFMVSCIQETVETYKKSGIQINQNSEQQKNKDYFDQHVVNAVYSTLLSNSLQLIGCGIQKNDTKNLISKCAKGFGIKQAQVAQLLKFIQNGYENFQRNKIKALLQSKK